MRLSYSSIATPVPFDKKSRGGLRFFVDYHDLNAMTYFEKYQVPLYEYTLSQLSKAKRFTRLDVKPTFHSINIRKGEE